MGKTFNIGKVRIVWRGEYSADEHYTPLDSVSFNGSSFINKVACTGTEPTDTEYWSLMAQHGDTLPISDASIYDVSVGIFNSFVEVGVVVDASYCDKVSDINTLKQRVDTLDSSLYDLEMSTLKYVYVN